MQPVGVRARSMLITLLSSIYGQAVNPPPPVSATARRLLAREAVRPKWSRLGSESKVASMLFPSFRLQ